jgi:hypothetical protein
VAGFFAFAFGLVLVLRVGAGAAVKVGTGSGVGAPVTSGVGVLIAAAIRFEACGSVPDVPPHPATSRTTAAHAAALKDPRRVIRIPLRAGR